MAKTNKLSKKEQQLISLCRTLASEETFYPVDIGKLKGMNRVVFRGAPGDPPLLAKLNILGNRRDDRAFIQVDGQFGRTMLKALMRGHIYRLEDYPTILARFVHLQIEAMDA